MKQGGRPRREDEKPDSPFGKALKEHLRRVEDFTQTDLARETGIPEKTLSHMVKGRRTSGTTLRRDLRDIIRVLYQKKVLLTLEEANRLITKIPAVKELDERDPDDAKIIVLLQTSESEAEQASNQDNGETVDAYLNDSSKSGDGTPLFNEAQEPNVMQVADRVQGPTIIPPHTDTPAPLETPVRPTQQHIKRWHIISVLAALVVILAVVFTIASFWQKANGCSNDTNGVTFYTDINYQGQCHTLGPGNYELALYGLDQKVSSIKNWHNAYHVKLFDKDKNFYNLDTDMPVLPAEWDNRADTVLIEKHRPTTCSPGTNGIIAFINPDYSGGCLFITNNIPDLIRFNFDSVIVSIQFIGSYQNTRQLVIYRQPDYKDKCGAYWQDQSDLLQCARLALSVQVLPFTPPTPIPNASGTRFAGNIAPQATLYSCRCKRQQWL